MEVFKRILAIIAIVISVVFIVASLAGVLFSWSINTPLTNAITGALTGVERVLTVADTGLERVNTRLAEAQTNVDTIEESVETAGETLSETSLVYQVLDRTVGDELFPKVAAAGETIVTIRDSVVAFNETLESINGIPFVEVPTLTENLETAAQRLETVQSDVEETRAELRVIREEAISKPVTAITDRTTRISDGLEAAQTTLSGTQINIDDNLESIGRIKARVPGLIDLVSLLFSFIFFWIALGQVGLIVLAWGVVKGSGDSEETKAAITVSDEEE